MQPSKYIRPIGLLVCGAILTTGCSAQVQSDPSEAGAQTTSQQVTKAPPPPASPIEFKDSGHTWAFKNASGYSYELQIAVAPAAKFVADQHVADDAEVGSACSINPQTDVIVPIRFFVKATTEGYDTPLTIRYSNVWTGIPYTGTGIAPGMDDRRVMVEQYFGSGPKCEPSSSANQVGFSSASSFGVKWDEPVPTGQTKISRATVIIKNYFTPATPDGDDALLDWIGIGPMIAGDSSVAGAVYVEESARGLISRTLVNLRGTTVSSKS